jgi:hypothetical protein
MNSVKAVELGSDRWFVFRLQAFVFPPIASFPTD